MKSDNIKAYIEGHTAGDLAAIIAQIRPIQEALLAKSANRQMGGQIGK